MKNTIHLFKLLWFRNISTSHRIFLMAVMQSTSLYSVTGSIFSTEELYYYSFVIISLYTIFVSKNSKSMYIK